MEKRKTMVYSIKVGTSMKASFMILSRTGLELRLFLMDQRILDIIPRGRSMENLTIVLLMGLLIKERGRTIEYVELVCIYGLMVENTPDNGKETTCMDLEGMSGQMDVASSETISTTKKRVSVNTSGQTVEFTLANGTMENSMDSEYSLIRMVQREKATGIMVRDSLGTIE